MIHSSFSHRYKIAGKGGGSRYGSELKMTIDLTLEEFEKPCTCYWHKALRAV